MKKLIVLIISILCFCGFTSYAASQYNSVGNVQMSSSTMNGALTLYMLPKVTIAALTAQTTGQVVLCQNCTGGNANNYNLCIASGTSATGQFIMVSTATTVLGCQ